MNRNKLGALTYVLIGVLLFTAGCRIGETHLAIPDAAAPSGGTMLPTVVKLLPGSIANAAGYMDITVDELAALLEQKSFTLVNVHIPYEGELPQTDVFIPFDKIADHLEQLPAKDAPIVIYCRSGGMSTEAGAVLANLGYINVYELDGGFNAWAATGHQLVMKAP